MDPYTHDILRRFRPALSVASISTPRLASIATRSRLTSIRTRQARHVQPSLRGHVNVEPYRREVSRRIRVAAHRYGHSQCICGYLSRLVARCGAGDAVRAMRCARCGAGDAAPAMRCARCGARDAVSRLRLAVTPKAFANASPGLLQPWVTDDPTQLTTLKALATAPHPAR